MATMIRILLLQLTFKRSSHDRNLSFDVIAKEAQVPLNQVPDTRHTDWVTDRQVYQTLDTQTEWLTDKCTRTLDTQVECLTDKCTRRSTHRLNDWQTSVPDIQHTDWVTDRQVYHTLDTQTEWLTDKCAVHSTNRRSDWQTSVPYTGHTDWITDRQVYHTFDTQTEWITGKCTIHWTHRLNNWQTDKQTDWLTEVIGWLTCFLDSRHTDSDSMNDRQVFQTLKLQTDWLTDLSHIDKCSRQLVYNTDWMIDDKCSRHSTYRLTERQMFQTIDI